MLKNLPANAGDIRDKGSVPGSGRCPGGGNGNPLQYSCLENPRDRGAWQATVYGVAKNWTRLNDLEACNITWRCSPIPSREASVVPALRPCQPSFLPILFYCLLLLSSHHRPTTLQPWGGFFLLVKTFIFRISPLDSVCCCCC